MYLHARYTNTTFIPLVVKWFESDVDTMSKGPDMHGAWSLVVGILGTLYRNMRKSGSGSFPNKAGYCNTHVDKSNTIMTALRTTQISHDRPWEFRYCPGG